MADRESAQCRTLLGHPCTGAKLISMAISTSGTELAIGTALAVELATRPRGNRRFI
jgi:hypothetical protein